MKTESLGEEPEPNLEKKKNLSNHSSKSPEELYNNIALLVWLVKLT